MKLISDIRDCLRKAEMNGRANFSVLGSTGVPEVRCNVLWSTSKGNLLVLSWLDGKKPSEPDALGLVTLFAAAARPEGGLDGLAMLREEYAEGLWHRTYSLPQTTAPATNISGKETARNAPCPCGSGKKFKKCHGGN